jgi:hypothetical protein
MLQAMVMETAMTAAMAMAAAMTVAMAMTAEMPGAMPAVMQWQCCGNAMATRRHLHGGPVEVDDREVVRHPWRARRRNGRRLLREGEGSILMQS